MDLFRFIPFWWNPLDEVVKWVVKLSFLILSILGATLFAGLLGFLTALITIIGAVLMYGVFNLLQVTWVYTHYSWKEYKRARAVEADEIVNRLRGNRL